MQPPPYTGLDAAMRGKSVLSVDVEDWFHILDVPATPPLSDWANLPSRVERNFHRLLDLFSEKQVRATCFFLGWIGEQFPHLVREAARRGHEIASHGYAHRLVFQMAPDEFYEDAFRSRCLLEDLCGCAVHGYRAAGFSAVDQTSWFFEALQNAGYLYDSSVFPARRGHGGIPTAIRVPHQIKNTDIFEFPVTVTDFLGRRMCFFGGGYLRLFPEALIIRKAREVLDEGHPVVFYVHPREIDIQHPRLPMGLTRRFKSYVNLHKTEGKLRRILDVFPMQTFREFFLAYRHQPAHAESAQGVRAYSA